MAEDKLEEISKKLNVLISMLLTRGNDTRQFERDGTRVQGVGAIARYLDDMELDPKDIANIIGAPLPSVRTLLTPKRKK